MTGFRTYILVLTSCILFLKSPAKPRDPRDDPHRNRDQKKVWLFVLGWNAVDDNSNPFKKLLSLRSSWNIRPYPTQLSGENYINDNWSVGGIFNYNLYKPGKLINGSINPGRFPFFSIDAFAKYYFDDLIKLPEDFDLYSPMGLGFTLRTNPPYRSTITLNLGLGFNYWITGTLGINVQSMAKFGLRSPLFRSGSNYLQHSLGIIVLFDVTEKNNFSFIKPKYPWVRNKGFKEKVHKRY